MPLVRPIVVPDAMNEFSPIYGPNLIQDPGFTGVTFWSLDAGWNIGGGVASIDGTQGADSALTQINVSGLIVGQQYTLGFSVLSMAAPGLGGYLACGPFTSSGFNFPGNYTFSFTADSTIVVYSLHAKSAWVATIDNAFLRLIK